MDQYLMNITINKEIAQNIFLLEIEPDQTQYFKHETPKPGQFLYVRVNDTYTPLLRRPISIHDYDPSTKKIRMIYRIEGEGTIRLSRKQPGDKLDILGPLGSGYPIEKLGSNERVVILGGGIGIPPLYYLAKKLAEKGITPTILLGYHSKETSFLIEEFSKFGEVRIASIHGSLGTEGTVLDLIKKKDEWDTLYSCGPTPMLSAIKKKWNNTSMKGYISLEERMGCGIGACYGCIVRTDEEIDKKGYRKVCADGPVFSFREVIL